jgi:hypothetical protein
MTLKSTLAKHKHLLVIGIAVVAVASYMLPIGGLSVPVQAQSSGQYGGHFPGKGHGVQGQPGHNGQSGNFPSGGNQGNGFPGKGHAGGGP